MTKLYNVVAHNLNETRKARYGKKKGTTPKEPERLRIGDNILGEITHQKHSNQSTRTFV